MMRTDKKRQWLHRSNNHVIVSTEQAVQQDKAEYTSVTWTITQNRYLLEVKEGIEKQNLSLIQNTEEANFYSAMVVRKWIFFHRRFPKMKTSP